MSLNTSTFPVESRCGRPRRAARKGRVQAFVEHRFAAVDFGAAHTRGALPRTPRPRIKPLPYAGTLNNVSAAARAYELEFVARRLMVTVRMSPAVQLSVDALLATLCMLMLHAVVVPTPDVTVGQVRSNAYVFQV
ncbi:MAG: hypothetical protein QOI24_1571 [Acidobacteriota bacterium]|nr:hypothetical protein [Acidobacteriota bacterium]